MMELYSPSNPDWSLWLSFRRAHEAIHKVRKKELRQYRLSTAESAVLLIVHGSKNKVTPAELSRQLFEDPHSISQLLIRMEKRGLLNRVKDFPRKNMIRIALTPKGLEAFSQSIKGESIAYIMSVFTESEREKLVTYLDEARCKAMEILHLSER